MQKRQIHFACCAGILLLLLCCVAAANDVLVGALQVPVPDGWERFDPGKEPSTNLLIMKNGKTTVLVFADPKPSSPPAGEASEMTVLGTAHKASRKLEANKTSFTAQFSAGDHSQAIVVVVEGSVQELPKIAVDLLAEIRPDLAAMVNEPPPADGAKADAAARALPLETVSLPDLEITLHLPPGWKRGDEAVEKKVASYVFLGDEPGKPRIGLAKEPMAGITPNLSKADYLAAMLQRYGKESPDGRLIKVEFGGNVVDAYLVPLNGAFTVWIPYVTGKSGRVAFAKVDRPDGVLPPSLLELLKSIQTGAGASPASVAAAAGSAAAPPVPAVNTQTTPLQPRSQWADYISEPATLSLGQGVAVALPAGALDQPRKFVLRSLSKADHVAASKRLAAQGVVALAVVDLDGQMAPEDRLREPMTVSLDLDAMGIDREFGPMVTVFTADATGRLTPMATRYADGKVAYETTHNGLVAIGVALITPAIYVAGAVVIPAGLGYLYTRDMEQETRGIEWIGMEGRDEEGIVRFDIYWPRKVYSGDAEYKRVEAQLVKLANDVPLVKLVSNVPAFSDKFDRAEQQEILKAARAKHAITQTTLDDPKWVREHLAWPPALLVEDSLKFARKVMKDHGIMTPSRSRIYLCKPWHSTPDAWAEQNWNITRGSWINFNMDKLGDGSASRLCDLPNGDGMELTVAHEYFHLCQTQYTGRTSDIWACEAAALVLERSMPDIWAKRITSPAALKTHYTELNNQYWYAFRNPMEITGPNTGDRYNFHGYGMYELVRLIADRLQPGTPMVFLREWMEQIQVQGSGSQALWRMLGKGTALAVMYRDVVLADTDKIETSAASDPNDPLERSVVTEGLWSLKADNLSPLRAPMYRFVHKLKDNEQSGAVLVVQQNAMSGMPVMTRAWTRYDVSAWRKSYGWGGSQACDPPGLVLASAETDRLSYAEKPARGSGWVWIDRPVCVVPIGATLQVICAYYGEDFRLRRDAEIRVLALCTPQTPPKVAEKQFRLTTEAMSKALSIELGESRLDGSPGFAGYVLRSQTTDDAGRITHRRVTLGSGKLVSCRFPVQWKDLLPADWVENPQGQLKVELAYADAAEGPGPGVVVPGPLSPAAAFTVISEPPIEPVDLSGYWELERSEKNTEISGDAKGTLGVNEATYDRDEGDGTVLHLKYSWTSPPQRIKMPVNHDSTLVPMSMTLEDRGCVFANDVRCLLDTGMEAMRHDARYKESPDDFGDEGDAIADGKAREKRIRHPFTGIDGDAVKQFVDGKITRAGSVLVDAPSAAWQKGLVVPTDQQRLRFVVATEVGTVTWWYKWVPVGPQGRTQPNMQGKP